MAKSNAERQKSLRDRRMTAGDKRIWIPKSLIKTVEKLIEENKDK